MLTPTLNKAHKLGEPRGCLHNFNTRHCIHGQIVPRYKVLDNLIVWDFPYGGTLNKRTIKTTIEFKVKLQVA